MVLGLQNGQVTVFEVKHMTRQDGFVIDLNTSECSCNFWQLVGIPCRHAISGMNARCDDPEDYVDKAYWMETYARCYGNTISAINGVNQWPVASQVTEILPPDFKRGVGRPKKLRKRDPIMEDDTIRVSRGGQRLKCGRCKEIGHNVRTCPVQPPQPENEDNQIPHEQQVIEQHGLL